MAKNFGNLGPVVVAENMRDAINLVNCNVSLARELVLQRKISFKPIPEPHVAFIGRVEYVATAIETLSHPVTADVQIQFPCVVIHALGGYGKTQTARKIASVCRKERKFQHFIWIDSEDDMSIRGCFISVRKQIGLDSPGETFQSPNFDSLVHQLYDVLVCRNNEKFLIIFDNVEDLDAILNYLPLNYPASNIAVLMTSQRPFTQQSYGNVSNQRLDLMLEEEAMELVENILGRSSSDSAQDKKLLVERSGRITLVLCVMTSTIKFQRKYKRGYRIKDYLHEMSDQPIQFSDQANVLDLSYDKSLRMIVRLAVDKLNAVGGPIERIAIKIFDLAAYRSSVNELTTNFVKDYLQDILEEANNVDMKLPMKAVDDLQIILMAIEKLVEFSLAELMCKEFDDVEFSDGEGRNEEDNNEDPDNKELRYYVFAVHRWIQASRRLDLRKTADERVILKKLLSIVPNMSRQDTTILWQHAADYVDLVSEFYAQRRTLWEFPISDIDVLEKIIGGLTEITSLEQFDNCSEEIDDIIEYVSKFSSLDVVKRTVDAFYYDVSRRSADYIANAITYRRLDILKWLVNEKSCIPETYHLRQCVLGAQITIVVPSSLTKLNELNVDLGEIIAKNHGKNLLECLFNYALHKLESLFPSWTLQCIENSEISAILLAVNDLKPSRIGFGEIIARNPRKPLLECLFHYAFNNAKTLNLILDAGRIEICEVIGIILSALKQLHPLNFDSCEIIEKNLRGNLLESLFHSELSRLESLSLYRTSQCIESFEKLRVILSALGKLEPPTAELSEMMEKYSERNLLECLYICGRSHERLPVANFRIKDEEYENGNDLHWAAGKGILSLIDSIDQTLIESRTSVVGMTPLMCAVDSGAFEVTTVLLEKYSANVNAMDDEGRTALTYAIKNYRPLIVKVLLNHGAKTNWNTKSGATNYALHEAVKTYTDNDGPQHEQVVEAVILSTDCDDVGAVDIDGNNILHLLVECYYATKYKPDHHVLQLMMSANAALVNMQNNDGLTPLQLAKNYLARFTDDHWHAKSLKSFISELDQITTNSTGSNA